jgi:hypothetical protein
MALGRRRVSRSSGSIIGGDYPDVAHRMLTVRETRQLNMDQSKCFYLTSLAIPRFGDTFVFGVGFGNVIGDFDAGGSGTLARQGLLDISGLGITSANFAAHVVITDLGNDMLISIDGNDHITLLGVTGIGTNLITQQDFLWAV